MRKLLPLIGLLLFALPARAQFIGFTSPQTVQQGVFNAITTTQFTPNSSTFPCTPPALGSCAIQNLGQNIHFLTGTSTNSSATFLLEGSNDGLNFFAISEEGRIVSAAGSISAAVYAVGSYAVVRARVLTITVGGGGSFSATYAGTSATAGPLLGIYSAAQQYLKSVLVGQVENVNATGTVNSPTGSSAGVLFFTSTGNPPGGSTVAVTGTNGATVTFALAAATNQFFIVPAIQSSTGTYAVTYTSGGAGADVYSVILVFSPPGVPTTVGAPGTQPPSLVAINQETSAVAGIASVTIAAVPSARTNVWSVSAYCSAGTSGLTITMGGTQVWSTPAAAVGAAVFNYQWNPGLANNLLNQATVISLATCGGGNTGTLDVQASQF